MRTVFRLLWLVLLSTGAPIVVLGQEPLKTPADGSKEVAVTERTDYAASVDKYLIRIGDTLEVSIERRPELSWRGQVNSDGSISSLPYVNTAIHVHCKSESKVAEEIATAYAEIIKNPIVSVRVIERSTVPAILLGAVRTPQRFQMQRDVRLIELLFISGGVTDRASGDIQVYRPVPTTCEESLPENEKAAGDAGSPMRVIKITDVMSGATGANPTIRAGDIVTVMEAEPVYVTGGVASPQGINFRDQLTLSRAIATVGGLTSNARGGEIRIYRRSETPTEQDVIKADYNAIRKQKQPDIPLKAYDIIEVPQSSGGPDRRTWQIAAQDIIMEGTQSGALPLRVLN